MSDTNKIMSDTNEFWKEILSHAIKYQQELYELLPDWTVYKPEDEPYLKQNIGFALYGPPISTYEDQARSVNFLSENMYENVEIYENILYNPEARKIIDTIFNKICEHGKQDGIIYCAIIYNVIFPEKGELTKLIKKYTEINAKKKAEKKETGFQEDTVNEQLQIIPVFKIRCVISDKKNKKEYSKITDNFVVKYIDNSGRVYQCWKDYMENNKLPKCTMVIPKNGIYQPDLNFPITEENSTVWVEAVDSPACSIGTAVQKGIDLLTNVTAVAGLGVTAATLVTPVAPVVVIGGLIGTGISSIWSLGRSTQDLVDRKIHDESISPTNRNALSSWLNIAGCTTGLATAGGAVLLSKTAASGKEIGTAAKVAYNLVVGGNLSVNLVGVMFQGYCLFDTYRKENTVDMVQVLFFATHAMFFGNAVMSAQFAHETIVSSQENVLKSYEATLRNKRHRKAYNRVNRNAISNSSNTLSKNAEVIRYIRKVQSRTELFSTSKTSTVVSSTSNDTKDVTNVNRNPIGVNSNKTGINFTKTGVLLIRHGIKLLDPMIMFARSTQSSEIVELLKSNTNKSKLPDLMNLLLKLLSNLYCSDNCPQTSKLPIISDFSKILSELQYTNNAEEILVKLFDTVIKFISSSSRLQQYLIETFDFIWKYVKMTLWDMKNSKNDEVFGIHVPEILKNIICNLYDVMDSIFRNLYVAFKTYYIHKEHV